MQMDLGEPSPRAIFTAVIYGDNRSKFGTPRLRSAARASVWQGRSAIIAGSRR